MHISKYVSSWMYTYAARYYDDKHPHSHLFSIRVAEMSDHISRQHYSGKQPAKSIAGKPLPKSSQEPGGECPSQDHLYSTKCLSFTLSPSQYLLNVPLSSCRELMDESSGYSRLVWTSIRLFLSSMRRGSVFLNPVSVRACGRGRAWRVLSWGKKFYLRVLSFSFTIYLLR